MFSCKGNITKVRNIYKWILPIVCQEYLKSYIYLLEGHRNDIKLAIKVCKVVSILIAEFKWNHFFVRDNFSNLRSGVQLDTS